MTQAMNTTALPGQGPLFDVWSRKGTKYRWQAIIMLILLGALFAGLCNFSYWLRTGSFWPWGHGGYGDLMRRSMSIRGHDQVTLTDFLTYPIDVQRVPIHGITMGLLFASLTSIPVLVAILYRFPFAAALAGMIVFLAGLPWLGGTVLLGCAIASFRPFRLSFRYASALLGLIPVAIYFVTASLEPTGAPGASDFQYRALLYVPWVLAVLGSCVICALALGIARLIGYRAGGIPPLLAVLFAIPVLLFHFKVGRDELEYRILEREIGPGSLTTFAPSDLGSDIKRLAMTEWNATPRASYDEIFERTRARLIERVRIETEDQRTEAVERCDSFMEQFSASRLVPSVLFLKGRSLDMRLDEARLKRDLRIEHHAELPSNASRSTWETLVERFPDNEVAVVALQKLAIIRARQGKIEEAVELLTRLRSRLEDAHAGAEPPEARASSVFGKASAAAGLGVDRAVIALHARRTLEMLTGCRADAARTIGQVLGPRGGGADDPVHPLQLYFSFDASDPRYAANLTGLASAFPDSQTAGFANLRRTLLIVSISQKIARLREAAAELRGRAAEAEALFQLGDVLREEAEILQDRSILDEAKRTWTELIERNPSSCWSQETQERLASLAMIRLAGEP